MMAAVSLREISIPRYAMRLDEAAASLGVSPSTFATWVRDGLMPAPVKIRGVTLFAAEKVQSAFLAICDQQAAAAEPSDVWGDDPA